MKKAISFLLAAVLGISMLAGCGAKEADPVAVNVEMCIRDRNEACTAVSEELPIITVIMNNHVLGMVYQWQSSFYDRRYSATVPNRKTDFVKLAEGFGAKSFRAETPEEFKEAFAAALQEKGPVWIECIIDQEEKVLPMIPNGGTVEDIILN